MRTGQTPGKLRSMTVTTEGQLYVTVADPWCMTTAAKGLRIFGSSTSKTGSRRNSQTVKVSHVLSVGAQAIWSSTLVKFLVERLTSSRFQFRVVRQFACRTGQPLGLQ